MAAAVQPNTLGTLRKHFTKPSEQVAAPPSTVPGSGNRRLRIRSQNMFSFLGGVLNFAMDTEFNIQLFGIRDLHGSILGMDTKFRGEIDSVSWR